MWSRRLKRYWRCKALYDKKRLGILPLFKSFKKSFYLAGGTSLALHIGHRDSVDFDFGSEENRDTKELFERLRGIFKGHIFKEAEKLSSQVFQ